MKTRQVKMKTLAKILKIVANVIFWVAAVVFCLFLVASIIMLFIPEKNLVLPANMTGNLTATIGEVLVFKFEPQTVGDLPIKPVLQAAFIWVSVVTLMMSIILFELKRILKSVVQDNPFEKVNSKNLTVIAVVLITGSFIVKFLEGRVASAVIQTLQISNISINYSIDVNLLLTGILILILAGVFQYGNYLQEEVDSTL